MNKSIIFKRAWADFKMLKANKIKNKGKSISFATCLSYNYDLMRMLRTYLN